MMDIGTVLRGLYASDISGGFRWWGDNGFTWWIGAASPEETYVGDTARTLDEAAQAMHETALKLYPKSVYAKKAKETPYNFEEKLRRIRAVRDITGCYLMEAKSAVEANDTVDKAVAAIRQEQARDAFGINAVAGPILAEHFEKEG